MKEELQQPGPALLADLSRMNPWWRGDPPPPTPRTRRHLVGQIHRRLDLGLAPILVVRGPRQVGKSTAQLHVIEDLLGGGVAAAQVFRVQFDDLSSVAALGDEPILRLVDWYEKAVLHTTLNTLARGGTRVFLFLDEVQNLPDWDVQLKFLVDHASLHAVVTGSSSLRIERGRDSLAGRITTLEVGTLTLGEIAAFSGADLRDPLLGDNGIDRLADPAFWAETERNGRARAAERDRAFRAFSERGGYPLAHQKARVEWAYLADQLNETIVRRVLAHDVGRKRDPRLLEEVFRLACRYAGQAPQATLLAREAGRALHAAVGAARVHQHLRLLADTLLVRLIDPAEMRTRKRRGSAKICLCDPALRASWLQEVVPLDPERLAEEPELAPLAGHVAESVVGATLASIPGLDVAWLPERRGEPEVDFVLSIGTRRVPIEVKYHRRIDPMRDTEGLRTFVEKAANRASFGVLVTQTDVDPLSDRRIVALPLSSLMLLR
jgi:uncharacterized protein